TLGMAASSPRPSASSTRCSASAALRKSQPASSSSQARKPPSSPEPYSTSTAASAPDPNRTETPSIQSKGTTQMIELRPFAKLGGADHGWLNAKHHFSFAGYYDPSNMGHGALRVWNDDEIAPNTGFPAHPHANMEIITYVREGAITHQDSLGNEGRTEAGDV